MNINYNIDPSMGIYTGLEAFILAYMGAIVGLSIACLILSIIGEWKIFSKAKQPGWACIVPFYSSYVMYKITWGCGWLFLVPVACGIISLCTPLGLLMLVIEIVFNALSCYKLSEAFGHKICFAVGLYIFPLIFKMILGFNQDEYKGIPIDGTSYRELKGKAEEIKSKEKSIEYEEPEK